MIIETTGIRNIVPGREEEPTPTDFDPRIYTRRIFERYDCNGKLIERVILK